jgi:hypothetical protein
MTAYESSVRYNLYQTECLADILLPKLPYRYYSYHFGKISTAVLPISVYAKEVIWLLTRMV